MSTVAAELSFTSDEISSIMLARKGCNVLLEGQQTDEKKEGKKSERKRQREEEAVRELPEDPTSGYLEQLWQTQAQQELSLNRESFCVDKALNLLRPKLNKMYRQLFGELLASSHRLTELSSIPYVELLDKLEDLAIIYRDLRTAKMIGLQENLMDPRCLIVLIFCCGYFRFNMNSTKGTTILHHYTEFQQALMEQMQRNIVEAAAEENRDSLDQLWEKIRPKIEIEGEKQLYSILRNTKCELQPTSSGTVVKNLCLNDRDCLSRRTGAEQ